MTTEYDKARNPEPKQTPMRMLTEDEYQGILERLDTQTEHRNSLMKRLNEVEKRFERFDKAPSPAQNPLFESKPSQAQFHVEPTGDGSTDDTDAVQAKMDRQRPSDAWLEPKGPLGETREPVYQLSDVMDGLTRQEDVNKIRDDAHREERQIILRALDNINRKLDQAGGLPTNPTIKEAETWPKEAPPDSEHFSCKRCGWRMGLNHHRTSRVMGLPETGTVACPGCASLKGWDRIGRNRDTVNIPTQEAL